MNTEIEQMIRGMAGFYKKNGSALEYDDLVQEGYVGYLKSKRTFKPEKLVPESYWARLYIKTEMVKALRASNKHGFTSELYEESTSDGRDFEDDMVREDLMDKFRGKVAQMDDRAQDIITRRLEGETLDSIGLDYHISAERVRQIEEEVMDAVTIT